MTTDYQVAVRSDVYKAIDTERDYQDSLNGRKLESGEEILLIQEYVERARLEWTEDFNENPDSPYLHMVRKIAGIAVRCLENYGAPLRG